MHRGRGRWTFMYSWQVDVNILALSASLGYRAPSGCKWPNNNMLAETTCIITPV